MNQGRSAVPPIHLVVPGPIDTLTGGFIYDRRMAGALCRAGRLGELICLEGAYPHPNGKALDSAARRLAAVADDDGPVVIDGLALTALCGREAAIRPDRPVIALIHHPLCDETGLSPTEANKFFQAERQALGRVVGCIVTSPATGRRLSEFGISPDRVRVVTPGLDQPSRGAGGGRAEGGPVRLLCVATLGPRKGQDILLSALADLRDLDWRLDLVGAARDPGFSAKIRSMATTLELENRIGFLGQIDGARLDTKYRDADIFVLPSYHEGFGMALAEAMAHGLPIVSSHAGAIPETVPEAAGELVPPGDVPALTASLRRFIREPGRRAQAGAAAREAAARMLSWARSGTDFIAAVDDLLMIPAAGLNPP